jgi:hypothetical protein
MKPHFIEIKDFETQGNIVIDMEGPYHPKNKRMGEHMYGATVLIDNIPYHFEKYIPTEEELKKFKLENEGDARFPKEGFLYRLVPFTR